MRDRKSAKRRRERERGVGKQTQMQGIKTAEKYKRKSQKDRKSTKRVRERKRERGLGKQTQTQGIKTTEKYKNTNLRA